MAVKNDSEEKRTAQPDATPKQGQFAVQKIYIKDISFEAPNSPAIFKKDWTPVVDMDVSSDAAPIGDDLFDAVLTVTVTLKIEQTTVYLVEVHQAGIFLIKNISDELIKRMLMTTCANILFPFAREVIADLITRGGFPQFLLQPINFDALYMQRRADMEKAAVTAKN